MMTASGHCVRAEQLTDEIEKMVRDHGNEDWPAADVARMKRLRDLAGLHIGLAQLAAVELDR